jgi:DNA-binding NarL/FixJ family response regulator
LAPISTKNPQRILIADEYEVVRYGVRSLLEETAWLFCGEAASGLETLDKARALQPDLILLDVTMPDLDAAQSVAGLLQVCPRVRIVAFAREGAGEEATSALAAGAIGLALKSDTASSLLLTVESVGRDKPFLSPAAIRLVQHQLAANRPSRPLPATLTPREREVLKWLAAGLSNKELAITLDVSVKTVHVHRANLMRKLELRSYRELIQFAIRNKLIEA